MTLFWLCCRRDDKRELERLSTQNRPREVEAQAYFHEHHPQRQTYTQVMAMSPLHGQYHEGEKEKHGCDQGD